MNWKHFVRIIILVGFFVSTLFLVLGLPRIFNSPDERANYVFTQQFAHDRTLVLFEELNPFVGGVIHPRSVVAFENKLLPNSFIGLPIVFGSIAMILGDWSVLLLTPILAVLAVIAWRQINLVWFKNELVADLAGLFLLIHPAFWLYTGRVMMHNVASVSFLIFALWFLFSKNQLNLRHVLGAGLMISLSLAFRSSEVVWISLAVFLASVWLYKTVGLRFCVVFLGTIALTLIPFIFMNKVTFGGFFETGYTIMDQNYIFETTQPVFDIQNAPDGFLGYIFPFGIHELATLRHVYSYGFWLFPWMSLLSLFGFIFIVRSWKEQPKAWRVLSISFLCLSVWLGVVYGSWTFSDNSDVTLVTLGNSYVRYWLPIYILASPFAAYGIYKLYELISNPVFKKTIPAVIVFLCIGLSINLVFLKTDGYIQTRKHLLEFAENREYILSSTQDDSIIIVDRADKYLFPERRVVVPLRNEQTYSFIPVLAKEASLYYFGLTLPVDDLLYLNEQKMAGSSYVFTPMQTINGETLYSIEMR